MSGFFLVARRIFDSGIWRRDPLYLKIFLWIVGRANYGPVTKHGRQYKRGELITTYDELREAGMYTHNRRIIIPSTKKVRLVLGWLAAQDMIHVNPLRPGRCQTRADSAAGTRAYVGLKIIVVNYEAYQNPVNYKGRDSGRDSAKLGHNIKEGKNKNSPRVRLPGKLLVQVATQFNELLCPPLPPVRISNGKLMSNSLAQVLKQRCGSNPELQSVDWWTGFFTSIKQMPFLMGDNHRNWQASLHWIVKLANFEKILDGNYCDQPRSPTRAPPVSTRQARKDDILNQARYLNAISDAAHDGEQANERAITRHIDNNGPDAAKRGQ